jgi:hypothetical protein
MVARRGAMNQKPKAPFEIPDLELPPSSMRGLRTQSPPTESARTPGRGLASFDEDPRDPASQAGFGELELAEESHPQAEGAEPRPLSPLPPSPRAELDTGYHPPRRPVPASWVGAPAYAWFVSAETRRLKTEEDRITEQLVPAQTEHDAIAMELARSLEAALSEDPRYVALVTVFRKEEQSYRRLTSDVAPPTPSSTEGARTASSGQDDAADSLPSLEAALLAARGEEESSDQDLRRVRARYQRLQIELRAVQGPEDAELPRREEIRAEMAQVLKAITVAESALEQVTRHRVAAERSVTTARLSARRAEDRLRTQQRAAARQRPSVGHETETARNQVTEAARNLCRTVLLSRNRPRVDIALLEQYRVAEEKLRVLLTEEDFARQSRQQLDVAVARLGWWIQAAALSLLGVVALWLTLR